MRRRCRVWDLGLVDYLPTWQAQRELAAHVAAGAEPDTLLLAQHPHTFTIGRRGRAEHVLLGDDQLAALGVAVYNVDRGGEVTYHGPGQLIAYPIVDLKGWSGPLKFVRALESVIIDTLRGMGLEGELIRGQTGVYVEGRKIAAIGLKVSRGVTYHGVALNVDPRLEFFRHIVPCGERDGSVTSVARERGEAADLAEAAYLFQYHFGRVMGFGMTEEEPALGGYSPSALG